VIQGALVKRARNYSDMLFELLDAFGISLGRYIIRETGEGVLYTCKETLIKQARHSRV